MALFNESPYRRERYTDDSGNPGGSARAAAADDFLAAGGTDRRKGTQRHGAPEAFSRAKDSVKQGLAGASAYVKSHDAEDVLEDARNIARRNPRVAIVALVAVGFLIGRLMRSSR